MRTLNRPQAFPGTEDEIRANRASHAFFASWDGEVRCDDCDCRPSGTVATWPCGVSVPREVVTFGERPGEIVSVEPVA